MIFIAGIVISLFLSALLLFKKNKSTADKILLAWFLLMAAHQAFYYFENSEYQSRFPFLIGYELPFPLIQAVMLFLYASALTDNLPGKKVYWLLHFLPAIACYIYLIEFLSRPAGEKLYIVTHQGVGYEAFILIKLYAIILSGIIYVTWTLVLLHRHQKKIRDNFSDIEKINLLWLQYLTYGVGIIWLTVIFGDDVHTFIAIVLYVMVIGFFGIRQTSIFSHNMPLAAETVPHNLKAESEIENSPLPEPDVESNAEKNKYQKSGLDEDELLLIHEKLTNLMQRERLYTNPELTLSDTAHYLNIHPNYLSQVINSVTKKNFYDYINSQRVEEFNRIVKESKNQKFTLLSLAFECGFNSKTSFNRNFRKVTGLSPSQYLKQMNVAYHQVN